MDIYGTLLGIQTLKLFTSTSISFQSTGQTSCIACFFAASNTTEFPGRYYFGSLILMKAASLTINSHSTDIVTKSIHLYVDSIDLEGTSYISADAMQIISLKVKVEIDARILLSARGYASGTGPGRAASCPHCAGAGNGGSGGVGYRQCDKCYSGRLFLWYDSLQSVCTTIETRIKEPKS